jgi:hypothetical protein
MIISYSALTATGFVRKMVGTQREVVRVQTAGFS